MTCSGDNGEGVHTVVFAHQFPRDVSDCFAVMTYVERAVGMDGTNLPALFGTKFFYGRPVAFIQSILQALLLAVADDEAFRRHGAYQMMELGLNGAQIGKNVGVVEFKIVQNGGTRTVVYEFGAFVKKGSVVFVGFDNEEWGF